MRIPSLALLATAALAATSLAAAPAQSQPIRFGFGFSDAGVVQIVPPGSPAETGGLRLGDRITAINGHDASGPLKRAMLPYLGALARTEQPAVLTVRRAGAEQTVRLVPARYAYPDPTAAQRRADAQSAGVETVGPTDGTRTSYRIAVGEPVPGAAGGGTLVVDVPDVKPPTSGDLVPPTLRAPDGTEHAPTAVVKKRFGDDESAPRGRFDAVSFRWRIDAAAAGDWTLAAANPAAIQIGARLPAPLDCAEVAWAWDASAPGAAEPFMGERTGGGFGSYTPYLGPRLFGADGRVAGSAGEPAFAFAVPAPPPVAWGHVEPTGRFVSETSWTSGARRSVQLTRAAEVARCLAPYLEALGEAPPELFEVFRGADVRAAGGVVEVGQLSDGPNETSLTFRHRGSSSWAPACLSGDCQEGTGAAVVGGTEVYTGPFRDGEPHGEGQGIVQGFRVRGVWADGELDRPTAVEAPNGAKWVANSDGEPGDGAFRSVCGETEPGAFSPRWDGFRAPPCPSGLPAAAQLMADLTPILAAPDDFAPLRGALQSEDNWASRTTPGSPGRAFVVCSDIVGPSCSHTTVYRLPSSDDALGLAFLAADAFAAAHPDWSLETTDPFGFGLSGGPLDPANFGLASVSYVRCDSAPRRVSFSGSLTDPVLSVSVRAEAPGALLGIHCPK